MRGDDRLMTILTGIVLTVALGAVAQRGEISPQDAQRYAQRAALSFDELGRPVEQQQQAPAPAGDLSGYSIEELERIANGGR